MFTIASDTVSGILQWIARMPDVLIVLLCCIGACLAALPVARATGLVGFMASRQKKLNADLDKLAAACASLAEPKPSNAPVPGRFRSAIAVLASVLQRNLPSYETFAATSTEADQWLATRKTRRQPFLTLSRMGPAVALGTGLGTLTLMGEVWANPAAMSSGAALGVGILVLTCVLSLSILSSAANWLEEAERADELAAGVLLESARMIAAGGTPREVASRANLLLRPKTAPAAPAPARKAA